MEIRRSATRSFRRRGWNPGIDFPAGPSVNVPHGSIAACRCDRAHYSLHAPGLSGPIPADPRARGRLVVTWSIGKNHRCFAETAPISPGVRAWAAAPGARGGAKLHLPVVFQNPIGLVSVASVKSFTYFAAPSQTSGLKIRCSVISPLAGPSNGASDRAACACSRRSTVMAGYRVTTALCSRSVIPWPLEFLRARGAEQIRYSSDRLRADRAPYRRLLIRRGAGSCLCCNEIAAPVSFFRALTIQGG